MLRGLFLSSSQVTCQASLQSPSANSVVRKAIQDPKESPIG